MIKTCRECLETKDSPWWNGKQCGPCFNNYKDKFRQSRGSRLRYQSINHKVKTGYESEVKVKTYLEGLGFKVDQTRMFGPDLTIKLGGKDITCEVKTVSHMKGSYTFYVPKIAHTSDHFCALVFPNNKVHIELMSNHLRKCSGSGKRVVSQLAREYGVSL